MLYFDVFCWPLACVRFRVISSIPSNGSSALMRTAAGIPSLSLRMKCMVVFDDQCSSFA